MINAATDRLPIPDVCRTQQVSESDLMTRNTPVPTPTAKSSLISCRRPQSPRIRCEWLAVGNGAMATQGENGDLKNRHSSQVSPNGLVFMGEREKLIRQKFQLGILTL